MLEEREGSAGRVPQNGEPAGGGFASRAGDKSAATGLGLCERGIEIRDVDVDEPHRGQFSVLPTRMTDTGDGIAAVAGGHRKVGVGTHVDRLGLPARDLRVEVA